MYPHGGLFCPPSIMRLNPTIPSQAKKRQSFMTLFVNAKSLPANNVPAENQRINDRNLLLAAVKPLIFLAFPKSYNYTSTTEPLIFQGFCFFLAAFHPNPTPTDLKLGLFVKCWGRQDSQRVKCERGSCGNCESQRQCV